MGISGCRGRLRGVGYLVGVCALVWNRTGGRLTAVVRREGWEDLSQPSNLPIFQPSTRYGRGFSSVSSPNGVGLVSSTTPKETKLAASINGIGLANPPQPSVRR